MAFIVPDVVRYTVNGVFADRPTANIVDVAITERAPGTSREDAIREQAEILVEHWIEDIESQVSSLYIGQSVSWVDLNDENGTTGSTIVGNDSKTFPSAGAITSNSMPGNASVLIRKLTNSSRRFRDGRMYVCGVPEADTAGLTPQLLDAARVSVWNTKLDTFRTSMNQDVTLGLFNSALVVVHITSYDVDPVTGRKTPATGDYTTITDMVCQQRLATQRRRLRK